MRLAWISLPLVFTAALLLSTCGGALRHDDESDDGKGEVGGEAGFGAGGSAGSNAGTGGTSGSGSSAGGIGGASGEGSEAGAGAEAGAGHGGASGAAGTGGSTGGSTGAGGADCGNPVDVIIAVDNSGSMLEEMAALEQAINVELEATLAEIDYRVILITRHRRDARTLSEEADTSVCVEAPLSSIVACPAEEPGFAERFFHYDVKVESATVLDWLIDAYSEPQELAPNGYGPWLRAGVRKAIIVATDDDEADGDVNAFTPDTFLTALTALDPTNFGVDSAHLNVTFHSIVGVKEKADPTTAYLPSEPVVSDVCVANGAAVESAGVTYQELSIRTTGLRFPLCQYSGYGPIFRAVAASACE